MGQAKPSAPGFRVPWARVGLVAPTRPSLVQSAAGRAVGPGGGLPDDALPAARSAPAPLGSAAIRSRSALALLCSPHLDSMLILGLTARQ